MNILAQEILHSFCIAPSSFLADFACAQLLRIEKPARYALIMTALHAAAQIVCGYLALIGVSGSNSINAVCQIVIYLVGPIIFSREKLGRTLFAAALTNMTLMAASTVAELIYVALGGEIRNTVGIAESNPTAYAIMFLVCFALTAILMPLIIRIWNRVLHRTSSTTFWYYLMFPVSQVLLWSLAIRYTSIDTFEPARHIPIAIVSVFCVLADVFLLRSVQLYSRRAVSEERAKWYEQLLGQQQSYYSHIITDLEDASKIRHDIRNQLQTAYSLLDSGDSAAARAQLDGIRSAVDQSVQYCAHPVVNALLSVKASRFAEAGMTLECRCDVPQYLPLAGVELCSLFSNVLDNAFNAAAQCEGARTVTLTCGTQGDAFTLLCQNPCPPEADAPREGHGLGLEILRDLAERHSGTLEIRREDGVFSTQIQLLLPQAFGQAESSLQ